MGFLILQKIKGGKTMKRFLSVLTVIAVVLSIAPFSIAESFVFSANEVNYSVEIPDAYLVYTKDMGTGSPLLSFTGASVDTMNTYMNGLGCSLCAVHREDMHEMWISVTDRSSFPGLIKEGNTFTRESIISYLNGIAIIQGDYREDEYEGQMYFIFDNTPDTSLEAKGVKIRSFEGFNEIVVRWESGTEARTEEDIAELLTVAQSIHELDKDIDGENNTTDASGSVYYQTDYLRFDGDYDGQMGYVDSSALSQDGNPLFLSFDGVLTEVAFTDCSEFFTDSTVDNLNNGLKSVLLDSAISSVASNYGSLDCSIENQTNGSGLDFALTTITVQNTTMCIAALINKKDLWVICSIPYSEDSSVYKGILDFINRITPLG